MGKKKILAWLVAIVLVGFAAWSIVHVKQAEEKNSIKLEKAAKKKAALKKQGIKNVNMRRPISWRKSSEKIDYPRADVVSHFWIEVSPKQQRVYLKSNKKTIYTMYASISTANKYNKDIKPLPKGTFRIQPQRGKFFYNPISGEGAKYWLSWKGEGKRLFHSVPTDENKKYRHDEAVKLGKKDMDVNTHGNIRLSVADAKWMVEHVPAGTKVVIR
ncbi:L,D-transpeptidase [Liquorilactobacillus capillatus]|uniref:Cell surface protein n=1 Tax=Liquorilactobacillus capillatus DSM 19910 TaxID=1423731 RepID=A0A0R1LY20_9LACO|nr:L,D-transpeptidase [Liquorilactobacillus capillatus]KRL00605.1 cell surface protein [Liquorilactobacillus capillatus DSM 19910]